MEIAPDFFDYFEAGAALMDRDKWGFLTFMISDLYIVMFISSFWLKLLHFVKYKLCRSIMAISSWNDNGQKQFVHDPCKLVPYKDSSKLLKNCLRTI